MERRPEFFLTLIIAALLNLTISAQIKIGNATPDIVLIATVCVGLLSGRKAGALMGFGGGMLEGVFSTMPLGSTAMTKLIIGYVSGSLKERIVSSSIIWPMIVAFVATLFHELFRYALWKMIGVEYLPPLGFLNSVLPQALYNSVLVIIVFPLTKQFFTKDTEVGLFR